MRLNAAAARLVQLLGLAPHPEGGHYRETYRSAELIAAEHLPARFPGPRCFATAIYFLLAGGERSRLHRIRSDEVWHFYDGAPLALSVIAPDGALQEIAMGRDVAAGQVLQAVVPAGAWYGAVVTDPDGYSLVGGTVAPGFDFADFELAGRAALLREFPRHRAVIERLTD